MLTPLFASAANAHHALPALRLRGGVLPVTMLVASPAAAAAPAALTNCVGPATGFFGNVRTPAALLTGAALGMLWTQVDSKRGRWVPLLFAVLVVVTIACEMSVVFISTSTAVRLSAGGFDPMATDAIAFLIRELKPLQY